MEHCKISNSKHQITGFQVSGVRKKKQKSRNLNTETSAKARTCTGKAIEL
jgi:hypothetical protein